MKKFKPRRFSPSAAPKGSGFRPEGRSGKDFKPAGATKPRRFRGEDERGFNKAPQRRDGASSPHSDSRKAFGKSRKDFTQESPRRFGRQDDRDASQDFRRGKKDFRKDHGQKPSFRLKESPQENRREAFSRGKRPEMAKPNTPPKPATQGVMLWGLHAVREAWLNPARRCHQIWVTEAGEAALMKCFTAANEQGLERPVPVLLERAELDRLLPPGSVHQGVALDTAPLADIGLQDVLGKEDLPDLIVVLDQVTDPHNVGAILRSAAAFGAGAVIMTERNAPSTTGVMAKTASGAAEHVPMIHVVNLARALTELKEAGYWCVGLAEEGAQELGSLDLSARTVVVLGAEGEGLRRLTREQCDELARLPTGGPIGSLNVSNAAAVALYEARRQKARFA